ncbi:MAG: family 43 glycosylhydrolase [Candidatus Limivivens sp.]|nr:family 43 glycosylhydrolase [Candidatus Limivivens sp.]
MNPVLPRTVFVPDVEARAMPDGKLYLYGSLDNSGDLEFCSTEYCGFSSEDLENWTSHGTIFYSGNEQSDATYKNPLTLGAPDCVYRKGTYYLYYCTYGGGERVAVSDRPQGPFTDAGSVELADGDGIDPAVLVDDDGKVYYFWGQFELTGAEMKEDMKSLKKETLRRRILTEHEHGFHEGASIRKRNGLYYMVYSDISRGRATCLSYAVSRSPLGPYQKQGVIIDNIGCDSDTWNNHGSIEEYNGQWYVFYHRSSQYSIYNRRVCIEPITFDEEGRIREVPMTSAGVSGRIPGEKPIDASLACRMRMMLPFSKTMPMRIMPRQGQGEVVAYTKDGDWVQYSTVDFGEGKEEFVLSASGRKPAKVEIFIEDGISLGECRVSDTGSWDFFQEFRCPIRRTEGLHTLWLVIRADEKAVGRLADLNWFYFQ